MTILTVEDVRQHLNLTLTDDDALIASKIAVAEAFVAQQLGTALDDATAFPGGTPEPVKEAVRQLVAHLYENREATTPLGLRDVSPGFWDLIAPYQKWVC